MKNEEKDKQEKHKASDEKKQEDDVFEYSIIKTRRVKIPSWIRKRFKKSESSWGL